MKPFRDSISASDGVDVIEDAGDGLEEADSAGLDRLQVQLLLHRWVQPLDHWLQQCRRLRLLLLLLLRLILNSLHARHRRSIGRERVRVDEFDLNGKIKITLIRSCLQIPNQ